MTELERALEIARVLKDTEHDKIAALATQLLSLYADIGNEYAIVCHFKQENEQLKADNAALLALIEKCHIEARGVHPTNCSVCKVPLDTLTKSLKKIIT